MLSRNGIRQPQAISCSRGSAATRMNTSVASTMPAAKPAMVKLVKNPRRPSGAYSRVSVLAPAASPPADIPCSSRHTTSSTGASAPTAA